MTAALLVAALPMGPRAPHHESQLLYSTQLRFTEAAEPIVTVGLMEGQDEVELTSPSGLRVHLSGPARTSLLIWSEALVCRTWSAHYNGVAR